MGNWLVQTKNVFRGAKGIMKSAGPFMVAQCDKASEKYATHKARLAAVEAWKELFVDEGKMLNQVRGGILKKHTEADAAGKVRLMQDLQFIEQRIRQMKICDLAISYLPATDTREGATKDDTQMSPHWLDTFNELARARNEVWREHLLARMLATEAAEPGSVSLRALMLIGTISDLECDMFHALLNVASCIGTRYVVPDSYDVRTTFIHLPQAARPHSLGNVQCVLENIGLAASELTVIPVDAREPLAFKYGNVRYHVTGNTDWEIGGVLLTLLGHEMSRFCERTTNAVGEKLLDDYMQSLHAGIYTVTRLEADTDASGDAVNEGSVG